jgi:hypothetical protein
VVVEDVEDLHVGAVGQGPVGGVGLPAFVGEFGFEAEIGAARPFLRLGVTKPRRCRIRQMVATDGTEARRRRRDTWNWMVCGPASRPSSLRALRSTTISSSSAADSLVGDPRGRFDRGANPSSPFAR